MVDIFAKRTARKLPNTQVVNTILNQKDLRYTLSVRANSCYQFIEGQVHYWVIDIGMSSHDWKMAARNLQFFHGVAV